MATVARTVATERCAGTSGRMTGSSGGPSKNRNALSVWTSKQNLKIRQKFWELLHMIDKLTIHLLGHLSNMTRLTNNKAMNHT